ncbi:unnamed protein product [Chrysoparadoxa australica]
MLRTTAPTISPCSAQIAQSYSARPFQPPFWARNAHVHTIIGSGEVQRKLFGRSGPAIEYRRETLRTPDGDFLDVDHLDLPPGTEGNGHTAVLTHGLESSSDAPLTARMALAFQKEGFKVSVMCFRSCSGRDNLTLGAYHLGFTDDLSLLVDTISERGDTDAGIVLAGFSLGGNVIAKYLGEVGSAASEEKKILGAVVSCVPFDAVNSQLKIDAGFNRRVYARNFLNSLIPKINRKAELLPELREIVDIEAVEKATSMGEFDGLVIAKIYGFEDEKDYYEQSGSKQYLKDVRVPLLCLQAVDDPFIESETLPTPEDCSPSVKLQYYNYGGHCGFISSERSHNEAGFLPTEMGLWGRHLVSQQKDA